jgi:hypothetical protein
MELDEVLASIAADGIEFVRFEQTDLHGISLTEPWRAFSDVTRPNSRRISPCRDRRW